MDFALSRVYATKILQILQNSTATGIEPSQGALQVSQRTGYKAAGEEQGHQPVQRPGRKAELGKTLLGRVLRGNAVSEQVV